MLILTAILGVVLVVAGFSFMFTPFATFFATGYFFCILFFIYGIFGIVRAITKKDVSVLGVITSIFAIVIGIVAIIRPGSTLEIDLIVLYLIAAWFILLGITSIVTSIMARKVSGQWVWALIAGILGVIVGIITFAHPAVAIFAVAILIGFFFIEIGFEMIATSIAIGSSSDN